MTQEQEARILYLREDLEVWEDRRRRARWSLPLDKLYNSSAMDKALAEMAHELHRLEAEQEPPKNRRRVR